jgi:hypothetical protein
LKSSQDHVISLKKENQELKEDVERLQKLANGVQMLEEDFAILENQQKEEVEQINLGFKQEIS